MTFRKTIKYIILTMLTASVAFAHRPGQLNLETTVENPYISWTFPGEFKTGEEVYVLTLNLDRGFAMPFEILTPKQDAYKDFRPRYVILGPGLPRPDAATAASLPKELPPGMGIFLAKNDKEKRDVYFEQVMRRTMYSSGTTAVPLRKARYQIWVWSPDKARGKFQFAFGVEENFSDGGFADVFENWSLFAY